MVGLVVDSVWQCVVMWWSQVVVGVFVFACIRCEVRRVGWCYCLISLGLF